MPSRVAAVPLHGVAVRAVDRHRQRDARPVSQQAAFRALLGPIRRVRPGRGAAERGLGHHLVHRLPRPVDPGQLVVVRDLGLPQRGEASRPHPRLEAGVDRRTRPEVTRQRVPLDAGAQDIDDRREDLPVGQARATAPGARGGRRDERLHPLPERVGDLPRMRAGHADHLPSMLPARSLSVSG